MLNIQENISLARYTTFRIGGPARFFVEVKTAEELEEAVQYAKDNNLQFFVLGGGSNVLVSDAGFDGLVIKIKFNDLRINAENNLLEAGAGFSLSKLVKDSVKNNLTGLEWAMGIPGTVGGAVRGNAGAFGGVMVDVISSVKAFDVKKMQVVVYDLNVCNFDYRDSIFKQNYDLIILSVSVKLKEGNKDKSQEIIREIVGKRSSAYPQGMPSAGSFFKNPEAHEKIKKEFEDETGEVCRNNKLPARWLIGRVDLLGKKMGGAMISEKHANFIVNTGTATAEDVIMLASFVKQQVRDKFGVQLQEEVQYIGFN